MKVIYKPTGQRGDIPDDKFDPNLFDRVQQVGATTQNPEIPVRQGLAGQIGGGVLNILGGIASPFIKTGRNIVGAGLQTPIMLAQAKAEAEATSPNLPESVRAISRKGADILEKTRQAISPVGLSEQQFQNVSEDKKKAIIDQLKSSANIASYAIPFGKGANVLTKAVLPGMGVGLAQGASEENTTPESVVGSTLLSGAGATGLYGASKLVGALRGVGKVTEKAGTGLIGTQFNLPRSIAKNVKLPETVGRLSDYGISNMGKINEVAEQVTGGNGIVTKLTRQAVGQADDVALDGLDKLAKEIVANPGIPIGQDKKLQLDFIKTIRGLLDTSKATNVGNPLSVFDAITSLEKKAFSFGGKSIQLTSADKAMRNAYLQMANELKDRLFINAGADNQVISAIADSAGLKKLATQYPKIAQDIASARTVAELRNVAEPFVNGSIAANITESGKNLAIKNAGETVKGLGRLAQNPLNIIAVPLGSDTVNAFLGKSLRKVGRVAQQLPEINIGNISGQIASRALTLPNYPAKEAQTQNAGNYSGPQYNQPSDNIQGKLDHTISDYSTMGQKSQVLPPISGYSTNTLAQGYTKAILAGDTQAATEIKKLYDLQTSSENKGLKGQSLLQYNAAQTALTILDSVENAFQKTSPGTIGPLSRIAGAGATLAGAAGLNPQAYTYNAFIQGVKTKLAKALGNAGNLSTKEQADALKLLPALGDTQQESAIKLEQLRSIFQSVMSNLELQQGGTLPAITVGQ